MGFLVSRRVDQLVPRHRLLHQRGDVPQTLLPRIVDLGLHLLFFFATHFHRDLALVCEVYELAARSRELGLQLVILLHRDAEVADVAMFG